MVKKKSVGRRPKKTKKSQKKQAKAAKKLSLKKQKALPKKPAVKKKTAAKKSAKKEKRIGKIIHYYGKIRVAIVKLAADLKVGDTVHIVGGTTDFFQKISSMEIEHKKVSRAKKGAVIGMKVKAKAREGSAILK